MSSKNRNVQLLAVGNIVKTLHYGHFALNWWTFIKKKNIFLPWRVNCRMRVEINETQFVLRVIALDNNSIEPEFISETKPNPQIHPSATAAINNTYKKLFKKTKTRYSGLNILKLEENEIIEQLLSEVLFQPFRIDYNNISIFIINIEASDDETLNFAGPGYTSSFSYKFDGEQRLIVQAINECDVSIHSYRCGILKKEYFGASPEEVWEKMYIFRDKDPMALFGLTDSGVIHAIKQQMLVPLCNLKQWADLDVMMPIFRKYLKRRIGISNVPWHEFFIKWLDQKSNIIELTTALGSIYPPDYKFGIREFRAWKQMMRLVGCTNITPFPKNTSQVCLLNFFFIFYKI
jgi:hypothetical protein